VTAGACAPDASCRLTMKVAHRRSNSPPLIAAHWRSCPPAHWKSWRRIDQGTTEKPPGDSAGTPEPGNFAILFGMDPSSAQHDACCGTRTNFRTSGYSAINFPDAFERDRSQPVAFHRRPRQLGTIVSATTCGFRLVKARSTRAARSGDLRCRSRSRRVPRGSPYR